MVSTIASLGILVSANVAPAMKSMDEVGGKVKDVGETSQKEGKKTEGFMKRWGASFAMIGAAATGALYMVIKASPLLSGAMREAQDAINLLFMTIGDALEPVLRPFVDALWGLSDIVLDLPVPLDSVTSAFVVFGGTIAAAGIAVGGLSLGLKAFGVSAAAAAGASAALSTIAFGGILLAAGAVALVLYEISGDPTTAIIGAFTTIGIGAGVLMHHPLIAATTAIIGGFVLLVTAGDDMEIAIGIAFVGIGVAATALLGHPIFAAGVGIVALFLAWGKASEDARAAIEVAIIGMIAALTALAGHPAVATLFAIVAAVRTAIEVLKTWEEVEEWQPTPFIPIPKGFGIEHPVLQYGGYVPYTGPAFLHAGEYVVPAGRVGAGVGGGAIYNVTNNFEINNPILGSEMDVDRLKQKLDELYRIEIGRAA